MSSQHSRLIISRRYCLARLSNSISSRTCPQNNEYLCLNTSHSSPSSTHSICKTTHNDFSRNQHPVNHIKTMSAPLSNHTISMKPCRSVSFRKPMRQPLVSSLQNTEAPSLNLKQLPALLISLCGTAAFTFTSSFNLQNVCILYFSAAFSAVKQQPLISSLQNTEAPSLNRKQLSALLISLCGTAAFTVMSLINLQNPHILIFVCRIQYSKHHRQSCFSMVTCVPIPKLSTENEWTPVHQFSSYLRTMWHYCICHFRPQPHLPEKNKTMTTRRLKHITATRTPYKCYHKYLSFDHLTLHDVTTYPSSHSTIPCYITFYISICTIT